jgi:hypothetical protein
VSLTRIGPDQRVEQRRQRGAGQGQGDRRGAAAADRAEREDEHGAHEGTGEGEPDVPGRRADAEQVDGQDDAEGGPGGDAEQARVAERVAGVALGQRAGDAQGQADHQAERGARHPQLADDDRLLGREAGVGQRLPDRAEAEAAGADRDAQRRGDDHEDEQQEQAEQAAAPLLEQSAVPRSRALRPAETTGTRPRGGVGRGGHGQLPGRTAR